MLKKTLGVLYKYLDSPDAIYMFAGNKEIVITMIEDIEAIFEAMGKDEHVENISKSNILKVLDIVKFAILEKPIDKELRSFVDSFTILIFNWNKNTENDDKIFREITYIERFVKLQFTVVEAINVINTSINRLKNSTKHDNIMIELSKHYMGSLQNEW